MRQLLPKMKLLACAAMMMATTASAQNLATADGLFEAARKAANEQKQYAEAIRLGRQVLAINPNYTDVVVFVGRVYAWDKQPDSARAYFSRALQQNEWNEDAYIAYADLELWNNNYRDAALIAHQGLNHFPYSQPLYLRKAKALAGLKDYGPAIGATDTVLTMNRRNREARALNISIKEESYKNRFTFRHDHARFDKQFVDDWYFGSLEYTRLTGIGPMVARVNYADRFKRDGLQFEADAYPHLSRKLYMYLNLGYSNNTEVFPRWRGGASLFANPLAFEAEAGVRYLKFNSDVFFYTGYVGKYLGSFLFGARTYITPTTGSLANANSALVRYYFGGKDDYINLNLSAGISPDDRRQNLLVSSPADLRSYLGELTLRKSIRTLNVVSVNFSILNQEYLPNTIGNQYQFGFSYTRHF